MEFFQIAQCPKNTSLTLSLWWSCYCTCLHLWLFKIGPPNPSDLLLILLLSYILHTTYYIHTWLKEVLLRIRWKECTHFNSSMSHRSQDQSFGLWQYQQIGLLKTMPVKKKTKVCSECATRESPEQIDITFSANLMAVCPLGQEIAAVRLIPSAGI